MDYVMPHRHHCTEIKTTFIPPLSSWVYCFNLPASVLSLPLSVYLHLCNRMVLSSIRQIKLLFLKPFNEFILHLIWCISFQGLVALNNRKVFSYSFRG